MKQHYKIVLMILMSVIISTMGFAQKPIPKQTSSFTVKGQTIRVERPANEEFSMQSFVVADSSVENFAPRYAGEDETMYPIVFNFTQAEGDKYTYRWKNVTIVAPFGAMPVPLPGDLTDSFSTDPMFTAGDYEVLIAGSFVNEKNQVDAGAIALSYDITIGNDSNSVTVNPADATNTISFQPVMQDGKKYPLGGEKYVTTGALTVSYHRLDYVNITHGYNEYCLRCNNLKEGVFITRDQAFGSPDVVMNHCMSIVAGPISQSVTVKVRADDYNLCEQEFALTPDEKQQNYYSPLYTNSCFFIGGEQMLGCGYVDAEHSPQEKMQMYVAFPKSDLVYGKYSQMKQTMGENMDIEKASGSLTSDGNTLLPNLITFNNDGQLSYYSPYPMFNLDVKGQSVVNFNYALLGTPAVFLMVEDSRVTEIYPSLSVRGAFNETFSLFDATPYVKKFVYNGDEIDLTQKFRPPFATEDSIVEAEFEYEDAYVNGTIKAPIQASLEFYPFNATDNMPPSIEAYNVQDSEGHVRNVFGKDEKGAVMNVSVIDYNAMFEVQVDTEVNISFSPQDEENWESVTSSVGVTQVKLDYINIEKDKWYKVKVEATDSQNNTATSIINNCFIFTDSQAVDQLTVSGDAEYYTLQGIRISNPSAAQVYIVKRGNQVSKEIYRK